MRAASSFDSTALLHLQRTAGNAAVSHLVSEQLPSNEIRGVAAARPVLQRDPPPPPPAPPTPGDQDIEELRRLNGLPMDALLAQLDGPLADRRSDLHPKVRSAWGVNFDRMEVAFRAVEGKGTDAEEFAFANYGQLRKLGYRDQRDAVLRFVDPSFRPPKKLEPGDKLTIGGLGAVVHRGHIRKQRAKQDGLPWIAYNPGAVGNGPSFKSPGGYGKTIGPAAINIYGSYEEGMAGLVAWIRFQATVNKMRFAGFFGAHAPKDDGTAANKGNDPAAYFKKVAKEMGLNPEDPKVRTTPLATLDANAIAKAIAAVGEGYARGGETLTWPDDADKVDRKTWFAMMYWETPAPSG